MEEDYETTSSSSAYNPGIQDSTFLQYRLDTTNLIEQIKITLSGKLQQNYIVGDNIKSVTEDVSKPLVNKQGFASIVNYVTSNINNQVVQGNISEDYHSNFCADIREDFSYICIVNMYEWCIDEQYFEYIVNTVVGTIKLFLTRLINNKERESYAGMQVRESQVSTKKPGLFR